MARVAGVVGPYGACGGSCGAWRRELWGLTARAAGVVALLAGDTARAAGVVAGAAGVPALGGGRHVLVAGVVALVAGAMCWWREPRLPPSQHFPRRLELPPSRAPAITTFPPRPRTAVISSPRRHDVSPAASECGYLNRRNLDLRQSRTRPPSNPATLEPGHPRPATPEPPATSNCGHPHPTPPNPTHLHHHRHGLVGFCADNSRQYLRGRSG
ncbi:MAG: hypothetical protein JWQ12_616 [Glaciihabitans sp.]|nr:hypothetical protein [Glaciihabitans sp.]